LFHVKQRRLESPSFVIPAKAGIHGKFETTLHGVTPINGSRLEFTPDPIRGRDDGVGVAALRFAWAQRVRRSKRSTGPF
jgi:hypothetical protein